MRAPLFLFAGPGIEPTKASALKRLQVLSMRQFRQALADGLARYLSQLGLERQHKVKSLKEVLDEPD